MARVEPTLMQWLQESMQNQKSYDSDSVIPLVYSKGKTEAKQQVSLDFFISSALKSFNTYFYNF